MRGLLAVLALCACGGGGVKYTSSTTKGVACGDFAEVFCRRAVGCDFISDKAACARAIEGGCCADDRTCGDRVYNPSGAASCVNRLETESCSNIGTTQAPTLPSYCRQMF